jgi:hypothetical protein
MGGAHFSASPLPGDALSDGMQSQDYSVDSRGMVLLYAYSKCASDFDLL